MHRSALVPVAVIALGLSSGCRGVSVPDLVGVRRIDPGRASAGERVTITGDGFPQGRPARVTFRGDVYHPGAAPAHDVRITVDAAPLTRNELVVAFDSALERRFTGTGDAAVHATFRGDLRVAFEPLAQGSAEVAGTARDVTFDVLPSAEGPIAEEREVEGQRVLAFLGLAASPEAGAHGLRISAVEPDGRAARAGFRVGDVLEQSGGVNVLARADLRVQPGQRTLEAVLERDAKALPAEVVDVTGLAPLGADDLKGGATLLLVLAAAMGLPATRAGLLAKWFARLSESRRPRVGLTRAPHPGLFESIAPEGSDQGLLAFGLAVSLVVVFAGFVWFGIGRVIFSRDFDLGAAFLGASLGLFIARFVDGGARRAGRFSMRGALKASAATLACLVPAFVAVAGAVIASGRFVLGEMVAEQGGVPWRWAAARNPGLALLFVALVATTIPESGRGGALASAEGVLEPRDRLPLTRLASRLSEWIYLWILCGLGAALFLGGTRVPGVSSLLQERTRPLVALGVFLFFVKVGFLVVLVGAVRRVFSRVRVEHVAALSVRWLVPLSLAGFVLAAGFATLFDAARSSSLGDVFASASVAFVALGAVSGAMISLRSRSETASSASVNPWL